MGCQLGERVQSPSELQARYIKSLSLDDARREAIKKHVKEFSSADDAVAWRMWTIHLALWLATIPAYYVLPKIPWVILRGALFMRSFIIFHDCTHESFFKSRRLNKVMGEITSAMCITPYKDWGRNHKFHHEVFGDLSKLDLANTTYFTKQQVDSWPMWKRVAFYVLRDPFLIYCWLTPIQWWIRYKFRPGFLIPTISHAVFWTLFYGMDGWRGVRYEAACSFLGALFGLFLFHLQHSANRAYRVHRQEDHDVIKSGLYGSTMLHLHPVFKWFTIGIEYHHIHHISTRVPCYKLRKCHESAPEGLWEGITHVDSFEKYVQGTLNTMWDDDICSLVTFPWYQAVLSACGFKMPGEDLLLLAESDKTK